MKACQKPLQIAPRLLLTCRQAAEALQVSERTLFNLTAAGELPAVRIGKRKCYRLADLNAFVERGGGGE